MFVPVTLVRCVEVAVVQIVHVIAVGDGGMAAIRAVDVFVS